MVTIKEIAMKTGYSIATVSRVINGNYPVSKKTKEKINQAIEELGYQPNALARGLKSNESKVIGIIVPEMSNKFFMKIIKGIEDVVSQMGYSLLISSTNNDATLELDYINVMYQQRVKHIFLATSITDVNILNSFVKKGLHIILIDRYLENFNGDYIVEESYEATKLMTDKLLEHGHKNIAVMAGASEVSTTVDRLKGFTDSYEKNGLHVNPRNIMCGGYNRKLSYTVFKDFLSKTKEIPTCVFALSNSMGEGCIEAILESNLKIPEDISVVLFGSIKNQEFINPKFSYVKQEPIQIGTLAAELFKKRVEQGILNNYQNIKIKLDIVEQNSVSNIPEVK